MSGLSGVEGSEGLKGPHCGGGRGYGGLAGWRGGVMGRRDACNEVVVVW